MSFLKSSLYKLGFILHLGHGGQRCPERGGEDDVWEDDDGDQETGFCVEDWVEIPDEKKKKNPDNVLVIADSLGIFRHRVSWCKCTNASDHAMQLFQEHLFPSSFERPNSAFTFAVLDHFYIDAMECKTAAQAFSRKLCRMTNNAFPDRVPVCAIYHIPSIHLTNLDLG
jgi:hypothetical protein